MTRPSGEGAFSPLPPDEMQPLRLAEPPQRRVAPLTHPPRISSPQEPTGRRLPRMSHVSPTITPPAHRLTTGPSPKIGGMVAKVDQGG